jgi:hypothetical protein
MLKWKTTGERRRRHVGTASTYNVVKPQKPKVHIVYINTRAYINIKLNNCSW